MRQHPTQRCPADNGLGGSLAFQKVKVRALKGNFLKPRMKKRRPWWSSRPDAAFTAGARGWYLAQGLRFPVPCGMAKKLLTPNL